VRRGGIPANSRAAPLVGEGDRVPMEPQSDAGLPRPPVRPSARVPNPGDVAIPGAGHCRPASRRGRARGWWKRMNPARPDQSGGGDDFLLPHSDEAECAVLGAILLDNGAITRIRGVLSGADFYRSPHRRIFRAMMALSERGTVIDPVTVREE